MKCSDCMVVLCTCSLEVHIGLLVVGDVCDDEESAVFFSCGIDGDYDLRAYGRCSNGCQAALLNGLDAQVATCEHHGTLLDGLDVADTRTYRVAGEVTVIYVTVGQYGNGIFGVVTVFFLFQYLVEFIF